MKKILIISDSSIGENFIQRVIGTYTTENIYYVVETKAKEYKEFNPARFKFYEFDATSFYKLANLLKMEFIQVIVAMENQIDVENIIKNIRNVKKSLRIIVLNKWKLSNIDPNVMLINSNDILSSRLLDYLPNVPVIAQNVGLGEGEIMEVLVPFGSSFVYKHIGVIEQKDWRIVAIYRNRRLVMPSRKRMIQPNDLLLLVGKPEVLKSVYRSIKRELGQFPEPFGSNLYLYLDMNLMNNKNIFKMVEKSVFIQQKLKQKLIIKIVNPNDIEIVEKIKNHRDENIDVVIDYYGKNLNQQMFDDIQNKHIGLVMVSHKLFNNYELRKLFYKLHVPILKISKKSFENIKESALILSDNKNLEKISSTAFDISEQMGLNMELHNFLKEHQENKEQVIEHYYNLATIFSKSIKVIKESQNSIRVLKTKDNFLQIIPFTQKIATRKIYSLLSTDSEKLYHKLDEYHQLFIPI